jgi:N-acyl-D-amino-acid deacylase
VLGEYVRDRGVLTLEDAVRKMTSLPAQKLRLPDRGIIRRGAWADVVVFDPEKIASRATYSDPKQYPVGVKWVLVNGALTVEDGTHTGARAGMVLRRNTSS